MLRFLRTIFGAGALAGGLSLLAMAAWAQAPTQSAATQKDIVGPTACAKCHKLEADIWQHTHHFASFRSMPRLPKAAEITKKMDIARVRDPDTICAKCHFTTGTENNQVQVIAGISCESCHGPGKNFIDVHPAKKGESEAQVAERLKKAAAAGMIQKNMIFKIAKNCYSCHIVPQEKLVNVGGHAAGSPFEMVSWSQGEIRHNNWYTEGKSNPVAPRNIQRKMYVIGAAVELSESLRAVGKATQNATYAVTMAKRAQAAAQRLQGINNAVQTPETKEMMAAVATAKLDLNNGPQLDAVADKIEAAAEAFDKKYDGSSLGGVDGMIPGPQYYKGQPAQVGGQ